MHLSLPVNRRACSARYPKYIRKLLCKYRKLRKKVLNDPNNLLSKTQMNEAKLAYDKAIHDYVRNNESKILCSGDPNKFYGFVRSKLNHRSPISSMHDYAGNAVTDTLLIAEEFRRQ